MKYPSPSVVQLTPKHGLRDCVIASMSAYLGKPYEQVVGAAAQVYPNFWKIGLENKHTLAVARKLGTPLKIVRDYDIDEDSGLLTITYHAGKNEHMVLLLEGRIYELEDAPVTRWEADAYLTSHGAKAGLLMVQV